MAKRPPTFKATLDFGDRAVEVTDALGRIDLDDLRGETEDAGALSIFYGGLHARAKRRASEAEEAKDVAWARLAREYRQAALKRNEKPVNDQVDAHVQTHPEYQAAVTHWLDMQEQADLMESVKFTMARKQSHLEAISQLLVQEELARRGPVPPRRTPVHYPQ